MGSECCSAKATVGRSDRDWLAGGRRGDLIDEVVAQEGAPLAAGLQLRHVAIERQTINARGGRRHVGRGVLWRRWELASSAPPGKGRLEPPMVAPQQLRATGLVPVEERMIAC